MKKFLQNEQLWINVCGYLRQKPIESSRFLRRTFGARGDPRLTSSQTRRAAQMKFLQKVSFLLLASCLAMGQAPSPAAHDPNSVAAEIKALREALAAQQHQIAQQQQQIEKLQKQTTAPQKESITADAGHGLNASPKTTGPLK